MSLIDLFREFHRDAIQREFPPSMRVLFYTLLGEFNAARWPDKLVLSERDLIQLTNLKKTTLHDAKRYLTSRHIIECKPFKNKNAYSFGKEAQELLLKGQPTTNRPLTDQSPTTSRPVSDVPYIRACEDGLDVKTFHDENDEARMRESFKVDTTSSSMDVHELWEYETGYQLTGSVAYELERLEREYGREKLHAALIKAVASKDTARLRFVYFKKVLEDKSTKAEGGKKREQSHRPAAGRRYDLSGTDREPDWLKGSDSKTQGAFGGDNAANLQTIRR